MSALQHWNSVPLLEWSSCFDHICPICRSSMWKGFDSEQACCDWWRSRHAVTDEVCLQAPQITVIRPVSGRGSEFPLSTLGNLNVSMWSTGKWNWMEQHSGPRRIQNTCPSQPQIQKAVDEGSPMIHLVEVVIFSQIFTDFHRSIMLLSDLNRVFNPTRLSFRNCSSERKSPEHLGKWLTVFWFSTLDSKDG